MWAGGEDSYVNNRWSSHQVSGRSNDVQKADFGKRVVLYSLLDWHSY